MGIKSFLRKLVYREKSSSKDFVDYLRRQGATIGNGTHFFDIRSNYFGLNSFANLVIGDNVQITHGVVFLDHGYDWSVIKGFYGDVLGCTGRVTIGNNVFLGANSIILKDVTIGDNVIIGAGSVVSRSIPANSVAVGNPCRVVESLEEYREKRIRVQLDEAFHLYVSFVEQHPGQLPKQEYFREYFWLFAHLNNKGVFDSDEFNRVMNLVEGSASRSFDRFVEFSKDSRRFASYEDFLSYCDHRLKSVNDVNL